MNDKDYAVAKELKRRLAQHAAIADIRVFGSRARGDNDELSDMDVFIEVETLDREIREKIFDTVWEVGFSNYLVIAPIICTRAEVEDSPFRASPILKNILEEGQRI
jgi:predicted nucleotidyltransferase